MSTFVPITRDEVEDWLDQFKSILHGRWKLQDGRAGVYLLPLSDNVAIKFSSTVGSADRGMGNARASAQFRLVSLVTGQVLNKKAQGQRGFFRTTGWKKNWVKGVSNMRAAYLKSQGFYDALAEIEDRKLYQKQMKERIESTPNWRSNKTLVDFHQTVTRGGILTTNQKSLMGKIFGQLAKGEAKPAPSLETKYNPQQEKFLKRLEDLDKLVESRRDEWTQGFLKNVRKRIEEGTPLSSTQKKVLKQKLQVYRVAARYIGGAEGATDRSTDPTVIQYAVQFMFKGKRPALAAKATARKLSGQKNMFLGPGETLIDPKKLEEALWENLVDVVLKGMKGMKPGKEHFALLATIEQFNQNPKEKGNLKKRVIKRLRKDPFPGDTKVANRQISLSNFKRMIKWTAQGYLDRQGARESKQRLRELKQYLRMLQHDTLPSEFYRKGKMPRQIKNIHWEKQLISGIEEGDKLLKNIVFQ